MHFTYRTKGTCSQEILFDVDGKTVKNIEFIGGCNGNLQGISKLVGTGGFFHAAVDAVEAFDHGVDVHALDELGNALQVAVAAADEFNIFDGLSVHVK